MKQLSVIIPTVNEWPQIVFTIQATHQDLIEVPHEILVIDNYCDEVVKQGREDDGTYAHLVEMAKGNPWLRPMRFTKKLSHWQAKNEGIRNAEAPLLLFVDAHTMPARGTYPRMIQQYAELKKECKYGVTLNPPITYHILEYRRLCYKLDNQLATGFIGYKFTPLRFAETERVAEVGSMITCGMMLEKELIERIGKWPEELGIYGGGENFSNFVFATIGVRKFLSLEGTIFHHGSKRGYSWNYQDHKRNQAIAMFLIGGEEMVRKFVRSLRGDAGWLEAMGEEVIKKCWKQRKLIRGMQIEQIEEWVNRWCKEHNGV